MQARYSNLFQSFENETLKSEEWHPLLYVLEFQ